MSACYLKYVSLSLIVSIYQFVAIAQNLSENNQDTLDERTNRDWSKISQREFNQGNIYDPWQLIQGRMPGLLISKPGSDPNNAYDIRVRGLSTYGPCQR